MADFTFKTMHRKQAKRWARQAANKLLRRRGVHGQTLANKKHPNGRPLGFGKSARGLPGMIRKAPRSIFEAGFNVVFPEIKLTVFHYGRADGTQVPRPVLGFSQRQLTENARELNKEIIKQGKRAGLFK